MGKDIRLESPRIALRPSAVLAMVLALCPSGACWARSIGLVARGTWVDALRQGRGHGLCMAPRGLE